MIAATPRIRPLHVLLIEDDEDHADLVMHVLEEHNDRHTCTHVSDGDAALAYLRNEAYRHELARPDLILLDINLPRVSGLDILDVIKRDEALRPIPVVVLTTSAAEADRAQAYNRHANSYLVKPISFEGFEALLAEVCDYWGGLNLGI
jgi:CheY-like chemotaxis protein